MKVQKSPLLPSLPTETDFKDYKRLIRWWKGVLAILTDHISDVYDDLNEFQNLPVYANNAAAIAGGKKVGEFYRTGANPDPVCVVH